MKLSEVFATRVRQIQFERKMTQAELSRVTTLHPGTLNDLFSGVHQSVNYKTIHFIIRGFGMKTYEFFNDPIFDREDIEVD